MSRILNEGYSGLRCEAAIGSKIKIDGKWLIDTSMGCGTSILGHNRMSWDGIGLYAYPNKVADECGELLHHCTGFEYFIFANSGTEATMKAIRLARTYTNRDKIALFSGCWHGSQDYSLSVDTRGIVKGIPEIVKSTVILLDFDNTAFDAIREHKPAIVMLEPIQGSDPVYRPEFLKELRRVCSETGTVLCFDEVITGFRMALGGMVEISGVRPDLCVYGKVVGGGSPIGVIAGNEVIKAVNSGAFMGGTFSANPYQVYHCRSILERLIINPPYKYIWNLTAMLESPKCKVYGALAKLKDIPNSNSAYYSKNKMILLSIKHCNNDIKIILDDIETLKV